MSTFDGRVKEFPYIRIDYFRVSPKEPTRPLAFFLSHVHSDHLQGLETCKSPFIYCSSATREILLRLEKYPHRMNFAKGILEARKQTYRHLKTLLKPIPLETPTVLELAPGRSIRVTLFDANHCTGATSFLIEDESHAIIYTGDIRSEQWWVDSLARHPLLIPYSCQNGEPLKRLDCIYLDTTFGTSLAPYRHFITKQEGITELLTKVAKYPADTTFYFDSWTFGYEDVWFALSAFLRSRIHVDDYRYGVYHALSKAPGIKSNDLNQLIGYYCGNHYQEGCLTRSQTRLHSCEYGAGCEVFGRDFVRITPIISRFEGTEMVELGAGGGQGDLDQRHELELGDNYMLQCLLALCRDKLQDKGTILQQTELLLSSLAAGDQSAIRLDPSALHQEDQATGDIAEFYDLPLDALIPAIVKYVDDKHQSAEKKKLGRQDKRQELRPDGLPKRITFPYSRHSSYDELRFVIKAFLPAEIYPCTINLDDWTESESMQHLFSDLYPLGKTFHHDSIMKLREENRKQVLRQRMQASRERDGAHSELEHKSRAPDAQAVPESSLPVPLSTNALPAASVPPKANQSSRPAAAQVSVNNDISKSSITGLQTGNQAAFHAGIVRHSVPVLRASKSVTPTPRPVSLASSSDNTERGRTTFESISQALQREAWNAATGEHGLDWSRIELVSTAGHVPEEEL